MEFKPFDKVLVRETKDDPWFPDIYKCSMINAHAVMSYETLIADKDILPYEGNEALCSKTEEVWKPKLNEIIAVFYHSLTNPIPAIFKGIDTYGSYNVHIFSEQKKTPLINVSPDKCHKFSEIFWQVVFPER